MAHTVPMVCDNDENGRLKKLSNITLMDVLFNFPTIRDE
jgi:hypothetical protein